MSTVQEIKDALDALSFEEKAEFFKKLYGWQDDKWDKQIIRDYEAGKLNKFRDAVARDLKEGRLMDLP